jgi:SpoVK/Ycf46/Vps4 family AAA+-type ATPase
MKKITVSLTEQNIEWLNVEAACRGLAVSDLIRRVIDHAAGDDAKALIRRDANKGVALISADNQSRIHDTAYVLDRMIEIPNPDGEDEDDNFFKPVPKATVADATMAREKLRDELVDVARRVNGLNTLLTLAQCKNLGPDATLGRIAGME